MKNLKVHRDLNLPIKKAELVITLSKQLSNQSVGSELAVACTVAVMCNLPPNIRTEGDMKDLFKRISKSFLLTSKLIR